MSGNQPIEDVPEGVGFPSVGDYVAVPGPGEEGYVAPADPESQVMVVDLETLEEMLGDPEAIDGEDDHSDAEAELAEAAQLADEQAGMGASESNGDDDEGDDDEGEGDGDEGEEEDA